MWPTMAEVLLMALIVFLVVGAGKFPSWGDAFGAWIKKKKG
jgi:Sec-independent protein translocase protein TatA